jgi:hypothetical protein
VIKCVERTIDLSATALVGVVGLAAPAAALGGLAVARSRRKLGI